MSIKQSIATLFILLSVSFSALAAYQITGFNHKDSKSYCNLANHFSVGDVYSELPDTFMCLGNDGISRLVKNVNQDDSAIRYIYSSTLTFNYYLQYKIVSDCPEGTEPNEETGKCESPPYCELESTLMEILEARNNCSLEFEYNCSNETETWTSYCGGGPCEELKETQPTFNVSWKESVHGWNSSGSYYCQHSSQCVGRVGPSFCTVGDGMCYATATLTGKSCSGEGTGSSFCTNSLCEESNLGDITETEDEIEHTPGDVTTPIDDPNVLPDWDGSYVPPVETEDKEEVEDPLTDDSIDSSGSDVAVVSAITGMNADMNKALNDLNLDINQNSANVQNEMQVLNGLMVQNSQTIQEQQKNDNAIYENTKALIQQANADITTAVNKNTNAINALGDELEGIAEGVEGIADTLEGLANVDTSGAGVGGTCIESDSCTGFYESGYPDGLGGMLNGHLSDLKNNVVDDFVNTFGNLDLSNASRPSFCMEVFDYGTFCFDDYIDMSWIFGFVRFCMIITSTFMCRRIIFGG